VAVKPDRLPLDTEDARRIRVQRAVARQLLDRSAFLEVRVDADEGLGPEAIGGVDLLDLGADVRPACSIGNCGKAISVAEKRLTLHIHVLWPRK